MIWAESEYLWISHTQDLLFTCHSLRHRGRGMCPSPDGDLCTSAAIFVGSCPSKAVFLGIYKGLTCQNWSNMDENYWKTKHIKTSTKSMVTLVSWYWTMRTHRCQDRLPVLGFRKRKRPCRPGIMGSLAMPWIWPMVCWGVWGGSTLGWSSRCWSRSIAAVSEGLMREWLKHQHYNS